MRIELPPAQLGRPAAAAGRWAVDFELLLVVHLNLPVGFGAGIAVLSGIASCSLAGAGLDGRGLSACMT